MPPEPKTVLQCDFDGTIATEDVSFMLLDAFAEDDWHKVYDEYHAGRITVGEFNTRVFAMVKANRETLVEYVKAHAKIREGLNELARACEKKGIEIVVVSNGLDFYIEQILIDAGLADIEFHAARTIFRPTGLEVAYIGPEGNVMDDGFKEAYARLFVERGCRVVYAGDGFSDAEAAKLAYKVFAIDGLLKYCRAENIPCSTFATLTDIAKEIENV